MVSIYVDFRGMLAAKEELDLCRDQLVRGEDDLKNLYHQLGTESIYGTIRRQVKGLEDALGTCRMQIQSLEAVLEQAARIYDETDHQIQSGV